jgi:hyaluronoglucosaminidase
VENRFWGVVEGFYHRSYTYQQRRELIDFLSEIGLNTYVYGPKSDPYHRKEWTRVYPKKTLLQFRVLSDLARSSSINFNYALSPIPRPDSIRIIEKINTMIDLGIEHFSLFFDDIKVSLTSELADKQAYCTNRLFEFLNKKTRRPMLFFCPTQYCGFQKTEYIMTIASRLDKGIKIFWTGPRVVSRRIKREDVDKITAILGRPPLIWDNLFANDYIPGIILRFPFKNRAPEIIDKVAGLLINPMNQFRESKPLIYTAARFFHERNKYNPGQTWRKAKSLDLS